MINELICIFKSELAELTLAATLREELKKQLLTAINCFYLTALDNDTFGFVDVSMATMLAHLHTAYGTITCAELETN